MMVMVFSNEKVQKGNKKANRKFEDISLTTTTELEAGDQSAHRQQRGGAATYGMVPRVYP